MRYVDPLGLAQRIVIVVGLGLGLMVLGAYLVSDSPANFGWFGYAPLGQDAFVPEGSGLAAWQQMLIWLALILVWSTAAVMLLKPRSAAEVEAPDGP